MSQHDLLSKAKRALRTAQLVLDDDDYDAAASRAYYAMFYAAEEDVDLLLSEDHAAHTHKGVLRLLHTHFILTGRLPALYGRNLNRAFQKRQLADYLGGTALSRTEAEEILEDAHAFVAQVHVLLGGDS